MSYSSLDFFARAFCKSFSLNSSFVAQHVTSVPISVVSVPLSLSLKFIRKSAKKLSLKLKNQIYLAF